MAASPPRPQPNIVISDDAYRVYPGPVLVLAGPGTGKTYQLAKHVQFLVNDLKATADEITVITFTKEAARSMKHKLQDKEAAEYLAEEKRLARISTMHSLGHSIIADNLKKVGLKKGFDVVEREELRRILFVDAALRTNLTEQDGLSALGDRVKGRVSISPASRTIATEYERILRSSNSLDYDDQILIACKLLQEDEATRSQWQARAKYLLVDEYQDINTAQFELIRILSQSSQAGLFVVGDDDQSIYGFRGGSPDFIRGFVSHFGEHSKVIQMKTSRRCKRAILNAANSLVDQHDKGRVRKIEPDFIQEDPGQVFVHACPSDGREAEIVASAIKDAIKQAAGSHSSAFILIPSRFYAKKLQDALNSFGIGYTVQLGESKAINHILLVRDWLDDRNSNLLSRELMQLLIESGRTEIPSARSKAPKKVQAREQALRTIAGFWDAVITAKRPLIRELDLKAAVDGTCKDLLDKLNSIAEAHDADFSEFLRLVAAYIKPWPGKAAFFDELESVEEARHRPAPAPKFLVRIMTIQSSKGLQADNVFIIGLEEGKLPKSDAQAVLAEEARLVFVGMTRAQNTLHLLHARKRTGSISLRAESHQLTPSRFLAALPIPKENRKYHPAK